jgi:hypothetical protein
MKTKTLAEIDLEVVKEIETIIGDPARLRAMGEDRVSSIMKDCFRNLSRIRSGGRSARLVCLSVLLWNNRERALPADLDPEDLLALAFHLALDPSLLFPEWGVVLAGVLLIGFAERLPLDSKGQTLAKCWRLVAYLSQTTSLPSVANAARTLVAERETKSAGCLNQIIQAALRQWPDTRDINSMPQGELEAGIAPLNEILPALWADHQRKIYRLFLERERAWHPVWSTTFD